MAITTRDAVKTHLGISGTSEDARLDQWLAEVEAGVLSYCRPGLLTEAVTEYLDGSGVRELVLGRRPVTAITGVWVDADGGYGDNADAFGSDTEWSRGTDYAVQGGLVASESQPGLLITLPGRGGEFGDPAGVWPVGSGNVKVSYQAGYTTAPADVVLAVHHLMASVRKSAQQGMGAPVAGESLGKYSYYVLSGVQKGSGGVEIVTAQSLLAPYKREPW